MGGPHVAIVCRDPDLREAAAAAFQGAPPAWEITLHESPVPADVLVAEAGLVGAGAVRLDPADLGAAIAEVTSRLDEKATGRVYLVTGAGGGVGTTTLALHLCAALRRVGTCCYVDLDRRWGAAARFDLDRNEVKTWAEAGVSDKELRLAALPMRGGFRALLAPEQGEPPEDLLVRAAAHFDRVIVDAPADGLDLVLPATAAVAVVSATRAGGRRAAMLLQRLGDHPTAIALVRTGVGGSITAGALSGMLGRPIAIELPPTPSLRDAEEEGRLLQGPWSRYVRRVEVLARALEST